MILVTVAVLVDHVEWSVQRILDILRGFGSANAVTKLA